MAEQFTIPYSLFHLTALLAVMDETEQHGNRANVKSKAKSCSRGLLGAIHQTLDSKKYLTFGGFMTDIGPELAAFRIATHELNKAIQVAAQLYEPADTPRPWTNPSMDAD